MVRIVETRPLSKNKRWEPEGSCSGGHDPAALPAGAQ